MLNADDRETQVSLAQLRQVISERSRPIVFWIGAGASRWIGYPSWKDLALELRREFATYVASFDNSTALQLINKEFYPELFQLCKDSDSARYHRFLTNAFLPKQVTEPYKKFIGLLSKIAPLYVLTTNVDEVLEHNLPMSATLQRSDIERWTDLVHHKASFVVKLHGSASAAQDMIFAKRDYEGLTLNEKYLNELRCIFTTCSVIFLGYGVRDEYVLKTLRNDAKHRSLFGAGPHFVVTNDAVSIESLRRIRYAIKFSPSHTAALSVLSYISQYEKDKTHSRVIVNERSAAEENTGTTPTGESGYFISNIMPPGTSRTSHEITAVREGFEIEASVGLGFTNDEIPVAQSTALHDIVVGLICFDHIYLPFSSLGTVHDLLGSEQFWELVRIDVLRMIHSESQLSVVFRKGDALGDIGNLTAGTNKGPEPDPIPLLIRKVLTPAPGKNEEAERLFGILEQRTKVYRGANQIELPSLVRSAVLMPKAGKLLGIGEAILPNQVPRWLRYSYLRLAHLVQTAVICSHYGIQSAKVPYGGVQLTSAAFGVQDQDWRADHFASYVASGVFNSDLGSLVYQDRSVVKNILQFRESSAGTSFRKETSQALASDKVLDFKTSVNSGLSQAIPSQILQRAHDKLISLMTEDGRGAFVPAVWSTAFQADSVTGYWRAKSKRILLEMCAARGIGKDDSCICGSGQKLRLCCLPPLTN